MGQNIDISQNAGLGSHDNTFIAEQHNYRGLSVVDAIQMAFALFREYYPQLREEALQGLREMVIEELKAQNPQEIISPSPRIAVPTLQSASITEEENIQRLYAKLLASAMNSSTASQTHPAFSKIIEQMSSFDATLMKRIVEIDNSVPVARITFIFDTKYLTEVFPHFYSPYFDILGNNWDVSLSIENLARLQLINLYEGSVTSFDYTQFNTFPFVVERFNYAKKFNPNRELKINVSNYVIQQNDFGKRFAKICMPK